MAYKNARRVDVGAVIRAPVAALQWRLLLLWLVFLLLPTAVVALPLWRILAGLLDHSVHAAAWAQRFDGLLFGDVIGALGEQGAGLRGSALLGLLLAVLMGPFLAGMAVAAGRAGRTLGLGQLLQSGVIEYGRMFRVMLWSLLPYAIAFGGAALAFGVADKRDGQAVLESQAELYRDVAQWVLVVLFVLAHAVVESARAAFIADAGLRSATRALGRGFVQLLRRPASTLLSYLVIGAVGYAIALAFGLGRLHTTAFGLGGFLLALLLAQLAVLAVGWTRIARLFALAEVSRSLVASRHAGGLPPAL
ncbi:hypothetical protein ASG87_07320 [Frateuria sp. Soil773]|uniref:hypothetical protein n=1 Tax=Frateuria sp. Soil773 TaxID=1736407 RepID=UPI0006FD3FA6|nr:hypothetical protein [Frateuria sp. Soil773]KRE88412.1 hypothetical protein ASG87_07320 [Frateuria sp. Soil773]